MMVLSTSCEWTKKEAWQAKLKCSRLIYRYYRCAMFYLQGIARFVSKVLPAAPYLMSSHDVTMWYLIANAYYDTAARWYPDSTSDDDGIFLDKIRPAIMLNSMTHETCPIYNQQTAPPKKSIQQQTSVNLPPKMVIVPSQKPPWPLKINGWKMNFPFAMAYVNEKTVSFRECKSWIDLVLQTKLSPEDT